MPSKAAPPTKSPPVFHQQFPLEQLKPWKGNPRRHGQDVQALVKSIQHFGWTNPVLMQRGTNRIIAGHGRVEAARQAGLSSVPIIEIDFTEEEASAYTVADNRLAELSEWDLPKLTDCLTELEGHGYDIELTGFTEESTERLIHGESSDSSASYLSELSVWSVLISRGEKADLEGVLQSFRQPDQKAVDWRGQALMAMCRAAGQTQSDAPKPRRPRSRSTGATRRETPPASTPRGKNRQGSTRPVSRGRKR